MKITAVTCVKNEGPFLLEWIAFNRVIGVTDFLFYSNDCTDHTDMLLDALDGHGIVKHLPNPAVDNRNYQMAALKACKREPIVKQADWVWVSDVDEFLNIHIGAGELSDLIDACGDPQAISATFLMMANAGVETFVDTPVISQFVQCHDPDQWHDQTAIEVKTLTRADLPYQYFGAHRPFLKKNVGEAPYWTDCSGRQVPERFTFVKAKGRIRKFPAQGARSFASLNHYALRSLESYVVKADRGDVNRENRNFEDDYWAERNDASVKDESILKYLPRLQAEIERLKALDGIAELHEKAVVAHTKRFAELMQMDAYRQLRDRLRELGAVQKEISEAHG
ncbi:MAG: glycosyltransferase family 2 protein [Rhodobacteraceae bacterium]|nr:glycosyltransferase family 2 protein [Paracoccaceae bacterium]